MTFDVKLGKKPKKEDPRNLKLARYLLVPELPPTPRSVDYISKVDRWPMYGNDDIGDCGPAMTGHLQTSWSVYGQGLKFLPSDHDVLRAYEDVGGYVLGEPDTDNGVVLLDLMKYWRSHGIAGHKIVAFVEVNPALRHEVMAALHLFGGIAAGLQLPLSAQTQIAKGSEWRVTSSQYSRAGSWGGHAVPYSFYNGASLECITWGQVQRLTWGFQRKYTDEAYVAISEQWLDVNGKSPAGLDLNALLADLRAVAG